MMPGELEPSDLARRLRDPQPPLLLDVREPDEFAYAAINGARNIPLRSLPQRLSELEPHKSRDLVVYCHHGLRSLHAARFLAQAGFTHLLNLSGGIDRWSLEIDAQVRRY